MHKSRKITVAKVIAAVKRDDMTGFCLLCGAERDNVEPDATGYPCEICGKKTVIGAEQLLFSLE